MLQKVNLSEKVNSVDNLFQYIEAGKLNNHILNVVKVENRTLDFHVHEESDELFYVIEGAFTIELDDGLIPLSQGDMIIIPKGTRHRPICKELVKCLLIELDGALSPENTGNAYAK